MANFILLSFYTSPFLVLLLAFPFYAGPIFLGFNNYSVNPCFKTVSLVGRFYAEYPTARFFRFAEVLLPVFYIYWVLFNDYVAVTMVPVPWFVLFVFDIDVCRFWFYSLILL